MSTKAIGALVTAVLALGLAACSGDAPADTATKTQTSAVELLDTWMDERAAELESISETLEDYDRQIATLEDEYEALDAAMTDDATDAEWATYNKEWDRVSAEMEKVIARQDEANDELSAIYEEIEDMTRICEGVDIGADATPECLAALQDG